MLSLRAASSSNLSGEWESVVSVDITVTRGGRALKVVSWSLSSAICRCGEVVDDGLEG